MRLLLTLYLSLAIIAFTGTAQYWLMKDALADDRQQEYEKLKIAKPGGGEENCKAEGKLLAKIVPCIRDTLQNAAETMLDQFDEVLKPAAYAFMTLILTFHGIKVAIGEGDAKKDTMMLLAKICLVILFMDNLGGFTPSLFGSVQAGAEMVTTSLGASLSEMKCDTGGYTGESPWKEMDCILGELFGFAPNVVVGSSVFGLMGAAIWSGKLGITLFMGGIAALFLIFRLIIRATYTYLMALMVMAFLIVISPLMIPLLIFGPTFQYFEHWLKALISTMIQPLITLCYITLCFIVFDKILFDEEMGLAKQLPKEEISKMWNGNQIKNSESFANNPGAFYNKFYGITDDWMKSPYGMNEANPMLSGATNATWWNEKYTFDFRGEEATKVDKIFFSMVVLLLVAYLLDLVLESLTTLSQQILGGGFALAKDANKPTVLEDKLTKMQQGMQQQWSSSPGIDQSGAAGVGAMVRGFPGALRGGLGGLGQ